MQAPPNAYIYRVCGIAGIYYFKREQTPEHLPAVIGALRHRGPDVQASAAFHGARLYHARLSIIDTSPASNQPYQQGSDALVYNGEIFNYRALGREVQPLTTGGDTEVLFKLLLRQGSECLPHLNGFFAFAFYQSDAHRLLVCRDRYGEKPLYYFQNSEFFAFASELKALLLLTGPQELDDEQLYSYLRLNFCSGERTILRGIKRLLPGHQIIVEK